MTDRDEEGAGLAVSDGTDGEGSVGAVIGGADWICFSTVCFCRAAIRPGNTGADTGADSFTDGMTGVGDAVRGSIGVAVVS